MKWSGVGSGSRGVSLGNLFSEYLFGSSRFSMGPFHGFSLVAPKIHFQGFVDYVFVCFFLFLLFWGSTAAPGSPVRVIFFNLNSSGI